MKGAADHSLIENSNHFQLASYPPAAVQSAVILPTCLASFESIDSSKLAASSTNKEVEMQLASS